MTTTHLGEAVAPSGTPPVTHQVEYPPISASNQRRTISQDTRELTACCPLAQGRVFEKPTLERTGQTHGKNDGQVSLRRFIQRGGVIAIPRSTRPPHIDHNCQVLDFALTEARMREVVRL